MKNLVNIATLLYLIFLTAPIWVSAIENKNTKNCMVAIEKSMADFEDDLEVKKQDFIIEAVKTKPYFVRYFSEITEINYHPYTLKRFTRYFGKILLPPPNVCTFE